MLFSVIAVAVVVIVVATCCVGLTSSWLLLFSVSEGLRYKQNFQTNHSNFDRSFFSGRDFDL